MASCKSIKLSGPRFNAAIAASLTHCNIVEFVRSFIWGNGNARNMGIEIIPGGVVGWGFSNASCEVDELLVVLISIELPGHRICGIMLTRANMLLNGNDCLAITGGAGIVTTRVVLTGVVIPGTVFTVGDTGTVGEIKALYLTKCSF